MTKFIVVSGGVISGIGKGVIGEAGAVGLQDTVVAYAGVLDAT